MKPSQIKETIKKLYQIRKPIYIFGPPGVGKSRIVEQVADEIRQDSIPEFKCNIIQAQLHEPGDLKFPVTNNPIMDLLSNLNIANATDVPGLLKAISQGMKNYFGHHHSRSVEFVNSLFPTDPDWQGILMVDELDKCPPMMQAAFLQPVLERKVGDSELPRGLQFVAAGNRRIDRSGGFDVISALRGRFCGITIDVCHIEWLDWAEKVGIDHRVRKFIEQFPEKLNGNIDTESQLVSGKEVKDIFYWGWPNPRSWEFVSDATKIDLLDDEVLSGYVGTGAANDFLSFIKTIESERKFPSYEEIVKNPMKVKIPIEPGYINSMIDSVVSGYGGEKKKSNIESVFTFIDRLVSDQDGLSDYGLSLFRKCHRKREIGCHESAKSLAYKVAKIVNPENPAYESIEKAIEEHKAKEGAKEKVKAKK